MAPAKGWHRERIKSELRIRCGSLTNLSVRWGYHRAAVSAVLRRPLFSQPIEIKIADALGVTPHTLWPDRWTPEGAPLLRTANTAPGRPACHRQNIKDV
jgi:Ner family transcriptional regulator